MVAFFIARNNERRTTLQTDICGHLKASLNRSMTTIALNPGAALHLCSKCAVDVIEAQIQDQYNRYQIVGNLAFQFCDHPLTNGECLDCMRSLMIQLRQLENSWSRIDNKLRNRIGHVKEIFGKRIDKAQRPAIMSTIPTRPIAAWPPKTKETR